MARAPCRYVCANSKPSAAAAPARANPPAVPVQVSPLCPQAHNVLATLSGSYEEALQHYRRGEKVGLQARCSHWPA